MIKFTGKIICMALLVVLFFDSCKSKPGPKAITDKLTVGDIFEIRVGENQSTGYEMCWMNKKDARSVSLVEKEYQYINQDCIGCAGMAVFTFKAVAPGKDTIKLVNCPTLREVKNCEDVTMEEGAEVQNFVVVID